MRLRGAPEMGKLSPMNCDGLAHPFRAIVTIITPATSRRRRCRPGTTQVITVLRTRWRRRRQGIEDISELKRTQNGRPTRATSEIAVRDVAPDLLGGHFQQSEKGAKIRRWGRVGSGCFVDE